MIGYPSFADFYDELHGREPLPWQDRLAQQVLAGSGWPAEVGVPTGLGKTTCLDIAVWWIASQAHLPAVERSTPTRIWWLVNRRLLVDSTWDHAERIAARLGSAEGTGPVAAVADRLRSLSAGRAGPPLQVVRLRGGFATGRPVDPSQPAVLLATLPMYGSRLLFRGYGSSRSMRPIDAALAGTDSLVLVDEAHLAHHLMGLFNPLADCDRSEVELLPAGRSRPRVVSLTATGSTDRVGRFDLDDADRGHPVVRRRLGARKPTRIVCLPARTDPARPMAEAALRLLDERGELASCVVFTNTPATARSVAGEIAKRASDRPIELHVLTGQQRERESALVRERILDPERGVPASREVGRRAQHLVVVATQTLEVGADVDFEYLVTEACGVRALTQRLGRLNRLGRFDHAAATYVHVEPATTRGLNEPSWPVYGREPIDVLERLQAHLVGDVVELGPAVVASVLGSPGDDPGRAPEVLPGILWEWVKTTTPPPGEAPVEPYFSGLAEPDRRISVGWRAHLPVAAGRGAEVVRIWPRVRDEELVEVSIASTEVREVLEGLGSVARLAPDRVTVEWVEANRLRPGDTCLLAADVGLLDHWGWNPSVTGIVADASLLAAGVPLERQALARVIEDVPDAELSALLANDDPAEAPALVHALVAALARAEPLALEPVEWSTLVESLDVGNGVVAQPGEVGRLVVKAPAVQRADELDELSAGRPSAVLLDDHGVSVGEHARAIATSMGLLPVVVGTVARAALFHDTGKADPRFQRWLGPGGQSSVLLAKSMTSADRWEKARVASGWPRGGRHEALSGRLVTAWLAAGGRADDLDPELLVHLVVSHHGHARPFLVPVATDEHQVLVGHLADAEVSVDADLSQPDWEQPDRFRLLNERYGHWGLCLLEAVVRQADHVVSAGGWIPAGEEIV